MSEGNLRGFPVTFEKICGDRRPDSAHIDAQIDLIDGHHLLESGLGHTGCDIVQSLEFLEVCDRNLN